MITVHNLNVILLARGLSFPQAETVSFWYLAALS